MSKDTKTENEMAEPDEVKTKSRRDFLRSLGRWSAIIIGGIALSGAADPPEAEAAGWVNARGGGGGGSWVNRAVGGGWINGGGGGGGSWVNRGGGWINGGGAGWVNRRGSWINRN
jgi:hypothetical protein